MKKNMDFDLTEEQKGIPIMVGRENSMNMPYSAME
jgi:hypothetical protein